MVWVRQILLDLSFHRDSLLKNALRKTMVISLHRLGSLFAGELVASSEGSDLDLVAGWERSVSVS